MSAGNEAPNEPIAAMPAAPAVQAMITALVTLLAIYSCDIFVSHRLFPTWALESSINGIADGWLSGYRLFYGLPGALLLVGLVTAIAIVTRRRSSTVPDRNGLLSAVRVSLLPLVFLAPTLNYDHVPGRIVLAATLIALSCALAAKPGLRERPTANSRHLAIAAVCLAFAVYTIMAIGRHRAHWSSHIDIGLYYELYDNAKGAALYSPTFGHSFVGEHFSPALILLWPLVRLFRSPETLIIAQSAALAGGGLLLFHFARARELSGRLALAITVAWLFNPFVLQAAYYDVHLDKFVPAVLFGLMVAMQTRRRATMVVCALLLWCLKEDTFLYTGAIGVFYAATERRYAESAFLVFGGLLVHALAFVWIMPSLHPPPNPDYYATYAGAEGYVFLRRYAHFGDTPGELARTLLFNPLRTTGYLFSEARLSSILSMLLCFGGLAVFGRWKSALLLIPTLEILLGESGRMGSLSYYYGGNVMHFAAIAAVVGAGECARQPLHARHLPSVAFAITVITATLALWHPASSLTTHAGREVSPGRRTHVVTAHHKQLQGWIDEVPKGATVCADGYTAPHLQPRRDVTLSPYRCADAEHVVLDLQRPAWPRNNNQLNRDLQRLTRHTHRLHRSTRDGLVWLTRLPEPAARPAVTPAELTALMYEPHIEAELSEDTHARGSVHRDDTAHNGAFRRVRHADPRGPGHLIFGPGLAVRRGDHEARFRFRWKDSGLLHARGSLSVATLDVSAEGGNVLASREFNAEELRALGDDWIEVALPFTQEDRSSLEFRVYVTGVGTFDLDRVAVVRLNTSRGGSE